MTTLYESYEAYDTTIDIYRTEHWVAQSFTPSITHIITSISIFCYKYGVAGEVRDLTADIYLADENGRPTGDALCSGIIDGDSVTDNSDGEWVEIVLDPPYILEAGTQYAIVMHADDTQITYMIKWKVNSAGEYADGVLSVSDDGGSSWQEYSSNEYDGTFREYGDTVPTILPSIELSLQALWGW